MSLFSAPTPFAVLALQEYRRQLAEFKATHAGHGTMADAVVAHAILTKFGANGSQREKKVFSAVMRPHRARASNLAYRMLDELIEIADVYSGNTGHLAADRIALQSYRIGMGQQSTATAAAKKQSARTGINADILTACDAVTAAQHTGIEAAADLHITAFSAKMPTVIIEGESLPVISNHNYPAANGMVLALNQASIAMHATTGRLLGMSEGEIAQMRDEGATVGMVVTNPQTAELALRLFGVRDPDLNGPRN